MCVFSLFSVRHRVSSVKTPMLTDVPLQLIDTTAPTTEIFLYIGVKVINVGPHPVLPPVVELLPRKFLLAFHHLVQEYLFSTSDLPTMESMVQSIRRPTIAEEIQAINELIGNMEVALAEAERQVAIDPSACVTDILREGTCTVPRVINAVASPTVASVETVAFVPTVPSSGAVSVAVDAVATGADRHGQQIASGSKDVDVPLVLTQPSPYRPSLARASRRLYSMSAVDSTTLAFRPISEFITLDAAALRKMQSSKAKNVNIVGPTKSHASIKSSAPTGEREPAVGISRRPSTLALRKCYRPARVAASGDKSSSASPSPPVGSAPRRVHNKRQAAVFPVQRSAEVTTDLSANEPYSSPAHTAADVMEYFPDPSPMATNNYDPDFLRTVDELLDSLTEDQNINT